MRRRTSGRGVDWRLLVVAVPAVAAIAALFMWPVTDDGADRSGVVVMPEESKRATGRFPTSTISPSPVPAADVTDVDLVEAGNEFDQMLELARSQERDARAVADESKVASVLRRTLGAKIGTPSVSCTATLCEIAATSSLDVSAAKAALVSNDALEAFAALGYSAGPDGVARRADGTAFVLYLNRET